MADYERTYQSLRDLLCGHVDSQQNDFRKKFGTQPMGDTGLTRRLWQVNHLSHYVVALERFARHRFARNFITIITHEMWTAKAAWLVEVLRLLDRPTFLKKGETRENLTIALYHEQVQNPVERGAFTTDQTTTEASLCAAIEDYKKEHNLKNFRDRLIFHLDLRECLMNSQQTGDMQEFTRHLVQWFAYAASLVPPTDTKGVTEVAPKEGRASAKTIIRLMLDSIRWQAHRGYRRYPQERYGYGSGQWVNDLFLVEEEAKTLGIALDIIADMGEQGAGIRIEGENRCHGLLGTALRFTWSDATQKAQFARLFNERVKAAGLPYELVM